MGKRYFQFGNIFFIGLLIIIFLSAFVEGNNNATRCCINKTIELCQENAEIYATGTDNSATEWNYIGNCYYNLKCYDKGIKAYENAIRIDPNYAEAWKNKGDALYWNKEYELAEKAYNNSIILNNSLEGAWYGKGRSLVRQNRIEEANALYKEFRKYNFQTNKLGSLISYIEIYFIMILIMSIFFYFEDYLFKIIKNIFGIWLGFPQFSGNRATITGSIDSRLDNFRCIQNRWLSAILFLFSPWILLLSSLEVYYKSESDLLASSWLIIIVLSVFVFYNLILLIPDALSTLWNRNVFITKAIQLSEKEESKKNETRTITLETDYKKFVSMFEQKLNSFMGNLIFIAFGIIGGGVLDYTYYNNYIKNDASVFCVFLEIGSWLNLFIVLFAGAIIGFMAWRVVIIGWAVRLITEWFDLNPQFDHPDTCGGLSPLGNICLLNALMTGIFSSFLGLFIIAIETTHLRWHYGFLMDCLILLLLIALTISIIAFLWPIWNVHKIMKNRRKAISRKLDILGIEIDNLLRNMFEDEIELDSDRLQQRIMKLQTIEKAYELNSQFREWPFDSNTVKTFLSSIIIPILGLTGIGEWLVNIFKELLGLTG
jgi:tetratricopeptide (TPR) repeat protein